MTWCHLGVALVFSIGACIGVLAIALVSINRGGGPDG